MTRSFSFLGVSAVLACDPIVSPCRVATTQLKLTAESNLTASAGVSEVEASGRTASVTGAASTTGVATSSTAAAAGAASSTTGAVSTAAGVSAAGAATSSLTTFSFLGLCSEWKRALTLRGEGSAVVPREMERTHFSRTPGPLTFLGVSLTSSAGVSTAASAGTSFSLAGREGGERKSGDREVGDGKRR